MKRNPASSVLTFISSRGRGRFTGLIREVETTAPTAIAIAVAYTAAGPRKA